jgi:hypothetical protein
MAVPVLHGGIRFRSTLEARWTVVLDGLEIPWVYEPKKFELPSGAYVPDFLVYPDREQATWIEVKGPWPDAREFQVASEINLYVSPLLILTGDLPRRGHGGTAWWFDRETARWSMVSPLEGLLRTVYSGVQEHELFGEQHWNDVLMSARRAQFEKATGVHQGE